jgi:8-oxo-dGTP pyrophosphatase MutT (NUDIX family)
MVLNGDQVLLIRHTYQRGWFMPGGGLKRNETLEEAARRELREETGLTVGRLDVAGVFTNVFDGKTDHVVLFRAESEGHAIPNSPEVAECRWFSLSALPEGLGRGSRQRIIELARDGAPVVAGRW